jgi:hypothetical protein
LAAGVRSPEPQLREEVQSSQGHPASGLVAEYGVELSGGQHPAAPDESVIRGAEASKLSAF